ncbi:hypothetical protein [Chelativorans sp. M5D2P16]|uniref:hypothetical protein n=1 Tax=Chelativorans sp. M5D2P16 TaxID=3095678 RepID=UPI002ACA8B7D|nr:hypothetical protein [Chelativorans sp. M5D2P16]MDZ5698439.1 hypothetical protein [Chelativorans sp. M5D2P16]
MTDKLAGLVLADATPVEDVPEEDAEKPGLFRRLSGHVAQAGSHDWLVAGCGIGLAAVCALFPWYIFFNQDSFGVRPLRLSAATSRDGPGGVAALADLADERIPLARDAMPRIDFLPTGTVPEAPFDADDIPEQPFPGDKLSYRLIDAGNGRAMIEDEDGFWIVQRGSLLPDGSRVAQIGTRDGSWVLVTSDEKEIRLSR